MDLAQEGLLILRILGQLRADAFENQVFAEEGVADEEGFTHAAGAESPKDLTGAVDDDAGPERVAALEEEAVHGTAIGLRVTLLADGAVPAAGTAHADALPYFNVRRQARRCLRRSWRSGSAGSRRCRTGSSSASPLQRTPCWSGC